MDWSRYQQDVFEAVAGTEDHLVVLARSGSGKTTTIIEATKYLPGGSVLLCAFNKSIQKELESRITDPSIKVRTLHSLGLWAHRMNERSVEVDPNKGREIAHRVVQLPEFAKLTEGVDRDGQADPTGNLYEATTRVHKLTAITKNTLTDDVDKIRDLAYRHGYADREFSGQLLALATRKCLTRAVDQPEVVDFDDMLWLPYQFDYTKTPRFDTILVDESQDLNPLQIWLLRKMVQRGRVIAVGDVKQSMYRFRGADEDAILRLLDGLNTPQILPLPITYRCATSIVDFVKPLVPDFVARDGAPKGTIDYWAYEDAVKNFDRGDFVLSRTNAPLLRACLDTIKRGIPAVITGRDIGKQLAGLIKKSKAKTMGQLSRYLIEYLVNERSNADEYPERYARAVDRVEAIRAISANASTPREMILRIETLFSDQDSAAVVTCSTVHKAKGLERDRVWMLRESFGHHAPQPWHNTREEANIWYVACTRARETLCLVDGP